MRILSNLIACVALVIAGCESPSQEALDDAALDALWPLPKGNDLFPVSDEELDRGQEWINRNRTWANTLSDTHVKSAYVGWIDYVQRNLDENREENKTHARKKEFDDYWQKYRQQQERAKKVSIPKPPKQ